MDSKNTISDEHDNFLFWKVGTEPPNGFPSDAFLSCLVPRPLAWVCVYEGISSGEEVGVTPRVCLLEDTMVPRIDLQPLCLLLQLYHMHSWKA